MQKYDLVSKNDDNDSLSNCNFQQVTGPEPEDSECMSLRSTQTQNIQADSNQKGVLRRMNSQENLLTSQFQEKGGW